MVHVGVDGCGAGWLAVSKKGRNLEYQLFGTIESLMATFRDAERIFIDIPIGLPSETAPIRPCDSMARRLLRAPRKSSVFPVPCRDALHARDFEEAKRINQRRIGRSVGAQTWAIAPKIAEVDAFLMADTRRCTVVREIHPEVCFYAFAHGTPMRHKKSTAEGRAERLRVLDSQGYQFASLLKQVLSETTRKAVKPDDLLDAAAAFATAEASLGTLTALSGAPERDIAGLPMEMWFLSLPLSRNCEAPRAS